MQNNARTEELAARRAANSLNATANADLIATRRALDAEARARDEAAVRAELEATLDSPWLQEAPGQGTSAASGSRVRKDHWRGMTATEKKAIFDEQFRQARARSFCTLLLKLPVRRRWHHAWDAVLHCLVFKAYDESPLT